MKSTNDLRKCLASKVISLMADNLDQTFAIGSGSTVNILIEVLKGQQLLLTRPVVAASQATELLLTQAGISVTSFNEVGGVDMYIDSADEVTQQGALVKGGGGALTREKILAEAAKRFVCIVDYLKCVDVLGRFPIAIEVLPMARSYIARRILAYGGRPTYRQGYLTDNGNIILDVYDLLLIDPEGVEGVIERWPGVICCGIFAMRRPNDLFIASEDGVNHKIFR